MIRVSDGKVVAEGSQKDILRDRECLRKYLRYIDKSAESVYINGTEYRLNQMVFTEYRGHYAFIYTLDGRVAKERIKQCDLERKLLPFEQFAIPCRGVIVNTEQVRWINDGLVAMNDGTSFPVSRKRLNTLSNKVVSNRYYPEFPQIWAVGGVQEV